MTYDSIYNNMQALSWTGDKRNWTFLKFLLKHKSLHADLRRLSDYGHVYPDESRLVTLLLGGIKHTSMGAAVAVVTQNSALRKTFELASRRLKMSYELIRRPDSHGGTRNSSIQAL